MSQSKCTKAILPENAGVSFTFSNGTLIEALLSDMSPDMVTNLALHGLSQKIGDSYAGTKDVEDSIAFASAMLKRLQEGEWKVAREGGGGAQRTSMIVEALAAATGKTRDEALEVVATLDKDKVAALKKHPLVAAELAKIAAARAAAKAEQLAAEATEGEVPGFEF